MLAPGTSLEIQTPAKAQMKETLPGTSQRCLLGTHGLSDFRPPGIRGSDCQPALGDYTGPFNYSSQAAQPACSHFCPLCTVSES